MINEIVKDIYVFVCLGDVCYGCSRPAHVLDDKNRDVKQLNAKTVAQMRYITEHFTSTKVNSALLHYLASSYVDTFEFLWEYDSEGRPVKVPFELNGKMYNHQIYAYENGNLISFSAVDFAYEDESLVNNPFTYEFDNDGYMTVMSWEGNTNISFIYE